MVFAGFPLFAGGFFLGDFTGVGFCSLDRLVGGSSGVSVDDLLLVLTCEVGVGVGESMGESTRVDGELALLVLVERRGENF